MSPQHQNTQQKYKEKTAKKEEERKLKRRKFVLVSIVANMLSQAAVL